MEPTRHMLPCSGRAVRQQRKVCGCIAWLEGVGTSLVVFPAAGSSAVPLNLKCSSS